MRTFAIIALLMHSKPHKALCEFAREQHNIVRMHGNAGSSKENHFAICVYSRKCDFEICLYKRVKCLNCSIDSLESRFIRFGMESLKESDSL